MRIEINDSQVKYQTAKAFLIKIPGEQWGFWLTSKCVYPDGEGFSIYLNNNYTYYTTNLRSKKKQKSEVLGEDLIEAFAHTVVLGPHDESQPTYVKHVPEDKEPIERRVIDNDLIRDPKESN